MGLSKNKIGLLREFVGWKCEICGDLEDECGILEPHRIRRGCEGGLYILRNIKMICSSNHKKIHSGEF